MSWSDKTVRLWDAATGNQHGELMQHDGQVWEATYLPDAPGGPRIMCWYIETRQSRETGPGHNDAPSSWTWTKFWDAATGMAIGKEIREYHLVAGAAYLSDAPGGARIMTWSSSRARPDGGYWSTFWNVRLWDPATGYSVGEPMHHTGSIGGATYLPDTPGGPRVMSWSNDKTVRLWDAATGEPAGEPMLHEDGVAGASYVPDAEGHPRIMSWSGKTVQLWDSMTGALLDRPLEHQDEVAGASYVEGAPSGPCILSWSKRSVHLWRVLARQEVAVPVRMDDPIAGTPLLIYGESRPTRLLVFTNRPHLLFLSDLS
jgi:WD40 repeat protein